MFGWEFPPHILGGLGTASYGLTYGLAQQGDMDIVFVLPRPWGDEEQSFLRIIGANRVDVPGRGRIEFSGRYPDNLLEEISNYEQVAAVLARQEQFDVIHSHDWLTYPAGATAKRLSGKPLVIHVHATDFDRSRGQVNPTVYAIERQGMDMADHIRCVSNLTRQTVIDKYGQNPDKVSTVHNSVFPLANPDEFKHHERKDHLVTFLGRITMQKGPEYFVEAAALCNGRERRQDERDDRPCGTPWHINPLPFPRLYARQTSAATISRLGRIYNAVRERAIRHIAIRGNAGGLSYDYLSSVGLRRDSAPRHQDRLLGH